MTTRLKFTEKDFLAAVLDSRYDTLVVGVENKDRVIKKIESVFGKDAYAETEEGLFIKGNDSFFKDRYSAGDLSRIMNALVGEGGCEWDRAQTHESIRINAVEEAYELVDAINARDLENMEEETGDLLLQAVFHANIARRNGEFTLDDVLTRLCAKLVHRHTHIFGDKKASSPEEALKRWEEAKALEKKESTLADKIKRVPDNFPSLLRSQKILKKLYSGGLENDAPELSAASLIVAIAGAIKNGADIEVDVLKELDEVVDEFMSGKIKRISEHK